MTFELHVLEGEQQGARTVLPRGQRIIIGGAFDGDVVLRGTGVLGQRIALTADGAAVIMISSELPEILGMSDRILVMYQGRLNGEFSAAEATQEKILHSALGE